MTLRPAKFSAGFTIVELLIALAITAALLAAIAAAFNASVINYNCNEDVFKSINNARQALMRITTQLRTATAIDPNSPANQCTFINAEGDDTTYWYNNGNYKLYLITNYHWYVLCDNITSMTFQKNTATKEVEVGGVPVTLTYVKSVQVSMTVTSGDVSRTLSAAAVIRKNLD